MALRTQNSLLVKALLQFFVCCFVISARPQTDTLRQGQQLKDGEYLISAGGIFTLGFFTIQVQGTASYSNPETAVNHFIGIWYTHDDTNKPVWVANRDKPISGTSGKLEIDGNGDLKISQNGSSPINLKSNLESVRAFAILTDSGNFLLKEVDSDGSEVGEKVLWQSFDYPTDVLVPGMRLGFNSRSGQNWSLTSWVNDQVPAPGPFTLGADPNGTPQLVMWKRGEIYWRSGSWHDKIFADLQDYLYRFDYVSNKDGRYFVFSAMNDWLITFPMYRINGEGELSISVPADGEYANGKSSRRREPEMNALIQCGRSYNKGIGCVEHKLPECRRGKLFDRTRGYVVSDGFKLEEEKYILGINDCEAKCFNDCSCIAYAVIYPNQTGCELWSNTTQLVEDGFKGYREFHIQRSRVGVRGKRFWWILLIVAIAGTLLLLSLAWLGYRVQRKLLRVTRFFWMLGYYVLQSLIAGLQKLDCHVQESLEAGTRRIEQMSLAELDSSSVHSGRLRRAKKLRIAKKSHGLKLFSFESMVQATDKFSASNRLGQGGFGVVYKGVLENGEEIAIKRLSQTSKQGRLEFTNEIKVIAKLQHTNLVRLIGCCTEQEEKMVVYEYMKNKSLDYFLFDSTRKLALDWLKRVKIIDGVAQGLLYLHKYSRLKIIHRDLKSGNILLDEEMNPKISDFGMARIFEQNESRANTKRVVGTPGYMSPEYRINGNFSVKSDVFSFGVLLLEIITSKKSNGSYCSDRSLNLIGYAWELWIENRGSELIDQTLVLSGSDHGEAMRCINVGLLCVQELPADRPTMSTVVGMLNSKETQLPRPKKPAFFIGRIPQVEHLRDLERASLNNASISEMEAR